jgi:hypothetical protein
LLDGEAIVLAALFALAFLCLPLVFPAGFVAREEDVGDVEDYGKNEQGRIEEGIFERRFGRRRSFGNHGINQGIVLEHMRFYFNRNRSRTERHRDEMHLLAGEEIFA